MIAFMCLVCNEQHWFRVIIGTLGFISVSPTAIDGCTCTLSTFQQSEQATRLQKSVIAHIQDEVQNWRFED